MIDQLTHDFYKNQCDVMEKFVTPLKLFGVNYFSFVRIYDNGKVVFFCNHKDWLTTKINNKLFDYRGFIPSDVEDEIINHYHYHLYTGSQYKDNKVLNLLFESNRWNSIDLYNKGHNCIDILHFSGTRENTGIINFFINNLPLLRYYFKHFQIQFEDTIDMAVKHKHYISIEEMSNSHNDIINPNLFSSNSCSVDQEKKLMNLIPSLDKITLTINDKKVRISNREYCCLLFLTKGKSMKEIAQSLDLSPRTIECYIQNIKIKTGLSFKSELINLYNKHFGY